MLSALIRPRHSYPAMLLAEQPVRQRSVHSGPLVLGTSPLKILRLRQIGDQPVSRRFEPSSRIFLIGEQPNPWKLLRLQDKMSRPLVHISLYAPHYCGRRLYLCHTPSMTLTCYGDHFCIAIFIPQMRKSSRYGVLKPILYIIEGIMYGVIILTSVFVCFLLQNIRYPLSPSLCIRNSIP